jgi:hypothetical protein
MVKREKVNKKMLLTVRMTAVEYATLHRLAKTERLSMSDLVRAAAVTFAVASHNPRTTALMTALPEEWVQLKREVIDQAEQLPLLPSEP